MTIQLPTKAEQEAAEGAIRNPEGCAVFFDLDVGGRECGDLIYDGDWGSNGAGSIYVDFSIGERLNMSDDVTSSFAVSLNGIAIPQMAGLSTFPNIGGTNNGDASSTEFLAVSARAIANGLPLNTLTRFPGVTPDDVLRAAASLAPYSRRYTRIDPLKEPILYFQEPDAHFWPNEFVGDIFKRVEDQTPYKIRDNAWGGLSATLEVESTEVKDYRHYNASDFPIENPWSPPQRTERRYSRVVVFRRNPDGSDAFEPQWARIDYRGESPPLESAWLWKELDDTTEEASTRAKNLANKMARKMGRAPSQGSSTLPFFDPLLEIQDVFTVSERWEDSSGVYDRKWMCWVDTYKHYRVPLKTEASYSSVLLENDRLQIPALAMAGISTGVLKTILGPCEIIGGVVPATARLVPSGNLVPSGVLVPQTQEEVLGDRIRLDVSELDWVEENGDLITVGEDAPSVEVNGDLVSITCGETYMLPFFGEVFPNLIRFDGVSWAIEGDLVVIDPTSSDGHAIESGDLITIS